MKSGAEARRRGPGSFAVAVLWDGRHFRGVQLGCVAGERTQAVPQVSVLEPRIPGGVALSVIHAQMCGYQRYASRARCGLLFQNPAVGERRVDPRRACGSSTHISPPSLSLAMSPMLSLGRSAPHTPVEFMRTRNPSRGGRRQATTSAAATEAAKNKTELEALAELSRICIDRRAPPLNDLDRIACSHLRRSADVELVAAAGACPLGTRIDSAKASDSPQPPLGRSRTPPRTRRCSSR